MTSKRAASIHDLFNERNTFQKKKKKKTNSSPLKSTVSIDFTNYSYRLLFEERITPLY